MEIKLCGVGGQGLGVAGRLLGEAAILADFHVAQTTAYGVESRGGMPTSDVIISKDPIYFPEVRSPDALLIVADKGLTANLKGARDDTFILYDPGTVSQTIEVPGRKYPFQFLDIALREFGNREAATIIGLGALVRLSKVVPFETLKEAVKLCLPAKVHQQNIGALQVGRDLIAE